MDLNVENFKVENACVQCDSDPEGESLKGFDEQSNDNSIIAESTTKRGYFLWSPESIRMFLKLRFEMEHEFRNREVKHHRTLWKDIAQKMHSFGHKVSDEHCVLKYRNMLHTYKNNLQKEVTGRSEYIHWEHFNTFKNALETSDNSQTESTGTTRIAENTKKNLSFYDNYEKLRKPISRLRRKSLMEERSQNETAANDIDQLKEKFEIKKKRRQSIHFFQPLLQEISQTKNIKERPRRKSVTYTLANKRKRLQSTDCENSIANGVENIIQKDSEMPELRVEDETDKKEKMCSCSQKLSQDSLKDCKVFGDSIGTQMLNIKSSYMRSLVKYKVQRILFLAETGKLTDSDS